MVMIQFLVERSFGNGNIPVNCGPVAVATVDVDGIYRQFDIELIGPKYNTGHKTNCVICYLWPDHGKKTAIVFWVDERTGEPKWNIEYYSDGKSLQPRYTKGHGNLFTSKKYYKYARPIMEIYQEAFR